MVQVFCQDVSADCFRMQLFTINLGMYMINFIEKE